MTPAAHAARITGPTSEALGAVKEAALDQSYVSMGTRRIASVHEFYRYPARFSPAFARAAILAFSQPGDFVLDPFVGGGTSLVEARVLGRGAVGADINQLACFVTRAKATVYQSSHLDELAHFAGIVPDVAKVRRATTSMAAWAAEGYMRNVDGPETWRIRNVIGELLDASDGLESRSSRLLARCAILRTAQWALDMRDEVPSASEFRDRLVEGIHGMRLAAATYSQEVREARVTISGRKSWSILNDSLPGLASNPRVQALPTPHLVLTSPPYPGVYVNYHRWKVRGRWETPAPFWIAGCVDGSGLATYTMSARSAKSLDIYFGKLEAAWTDVAGLMSPGTWLVQMVGFNEPKSQLPRYLETMSRSGLTEQLFPELKNRADGRLWREVPGRRWWVKAGEKKGTAPHTASEVILVHRRDGQTARRPRS
jgi:DNA modification methylase